MAEDSLEGNLLKGEYEVSPDGRCRCKGKINQEGTKIRTSINWSGGAGYLDLIRIENQFN